MDVDAGAPALAPTAPGATLEPAATETALVPAARARAPLPLHPNCDACGMMRRYGTANVAHTCGRQRPPRQPVVRDPTAPAAQTEALAIFL